LFSAGEPAASVCMDKCMGRTWRPRVQVDKISGKLAKHEEARLAFRAPPRDSVTTVNGVITRAQRIHQYGGPEVIRLDEVSLASGTLDDVLVRVAAAGVGPWDVAVRAGKAGIPGRLPLTLGATFAGTVLQAGSNSGGIGPGVEIYGVTNPQHIGAYAGAAIAGVSGIAPMPPNLSFEEAASLPMVAVAAWQALFECAQLSRGQHVLIHDAAVGVGACAVQMARWAGAVVTAIGGPGDADWLFKLGADVVGDASIAAFESVTDPVDVVLDTVGGQIQDRSFAVLKPGGTLASIVSAPNDDRARVFEIRSEYVRPNITASRLNSISTLVAQGALSANVGAIVPFSQARYAHELLENAAPRPRGEIVLSINDEAVPFQNQD